MKHGRHVRDVADIPIGNIPVEWKMFEKSRHIGNARDIDVVQIALVPMDGLGLANQGARSKMQSEPLESRYCEKNGASAKASFPKVVHYRRTAARSAF